MAKVSPPSYPSVRTSRPVAAPARTLLGPTVDDLLPSYARHLRAEGRTPGTVDHTYVPHLRAFDSFLAAQGMPRVVRSIRREHIEAYLVELQRLGRKPATQSLAFRSISPFWKWAVEEGEIRESPMARMRPPVVPQDPPRVLTEAELQKLLDACRGKDFEARRDLAIISLLADSGMRRGECSALAVTDIDLDAGVAVVSAEHSKGRRVRLARFGYRTAVALERYLRVRKEHPYASSEALWLGRRGPTTGSGVLQILERRGRQAGVRAFVHQLRHTYAHQFLASGGQEGDLMQLAGWRDRGMLRRYGASAAAERARANYLSPVDRLSSRPATRRR